MFDLRYLLPGNLPQLVTQRDELSIRREVLLQRFLNLLLIILLVGIVLFALVYPGSFFSLAVPIVIGYLGVFAITAARQFNYNLRASIIILFFLVLGVISLTRYGLNGPGAILLLSSIVLAHMFFSQRTGLIFSSVATLGLVTVSVLMINGLIPMPNHTLEYFFREPGMWVMTIIIFMILASLIISAIYDIVQGLNRSLSDQSSLAKQLKEEQDSLEQRVNERATDLVRRLNQFEIASQVAREISGETNLESLLNRAVHLIRDRFGFYHVGVFLRDDRDEFAVLRAATGEAGRQMLEHGHRLKIGEVGLVGYAVSRGEARISLDVAGDLVHFKNPLLPDTRSEMALPLRSGDKTIGALDVQSVLEGAFTQDDVRILQTIADQLAIAFEKTRLMEQLQKSVSELETSHGAATQKAWRTHLRNTRQRLAYHYSQAHSRLENYAEESEQGLEALQKGQVVLKTITRSADGKQSHAVLAVPIKQRNQVLGVVDIRFETAHVSPDLIALIESTVNRLAVSLENTRLLEEIQFRAERERMVGEISSKVRAASDVDSVLKIAIQEIGRSLGVSEVMVQLRKDQ